MGLNVNFCPFRNIAVVIAIAKTLYKLTMFDYSMNNSSFSFFPKHPLTFLGLKLVFFFPLNKKQYGDTLNCP